MVPPILDRNKGNDTAINMDLTGTELDPFARRSSILRSPPRSTTHLLPHPEENSTKANAPKRKRSGSTPEKEATASENDEGAPLHVPEQIFSLAKDLATLAALLPFKRRYSTLKISKKGLTLI